MRSIQTLVTMNISIYTVVVTLLLKGISTNELCDDAKRSKINSIVKYRLKKKMYDPFLKLMYKEFLPGRCKNQTDCFRKISKLLVIRIKSNGLKPKGGNILANLRLG